MAVPLIARGRLPRSAIAEARKRLLHRADSIIDPTLRSSFLGNVAENARIIALADAWGS